MITRQDAFWPRELALMDTYAVRRSWRPPTLTTTLAEVRVPAAHWSVKTRGAFNRQLAARERVDLAPEAGIVTASGGNAGLANVYAAARLGVPATVFVPAVAPAVKVARLRANGAKVIQVSTRRHTTGQWKNQPGRVPCSAAPMTSPRSPQAPG
jgi:cysteine synthase